MYLYPGSCTAFSYWIPALTDLCVIVVIGRSTAFHCIELLGIRTKQK